MDCLNTPAPARLVAWSLGRLVAWSLLAMSGMGSVIGAEWPNPGMQISRGAEVGDWQFGWHGVKGWTYFLQHSPNILEWSYLPWIASGNDGLLGLTVRSSASAGFFRWRATDRSAADPWTADFDGDGVSNGDELLQGTDPLSAADGDANGLPDDWELCYFQRIGVDPHATAPGGGMTNLQHFTLGSNPHNPPPPPTITAGTATLEQNADTLLYPADDSHLLLQNGNFSQGDSSLPSLGSNSWWPYPSGILGWTAISGQIVELQQIEVNTIARAGQYGELDAHWPTSDHRGDSDHGIQQTRNLARGHYLLFFDYRGREHDVEAGSFTVKVKSAGSSSDVLLVTQNSASTTDWKRASVSFEITGGNPNATTLPITLQFDSSDARDSYGAYIDNIMLIPVEVKVVDRDDPKKQWSDAQDGSGRKLYAGETTGDMISWKLGGTDSWSSVNFNWSAEGPNSQTIQGPSGTGKNEWKIADGDEDTVNDWLKWKPGKWKIKVQVGSISTEFEQQVGWRTEDYLVIGQIVETYSHNNDKPGTLGSAWQFRRALVYDIDAEFFGGGGETVAVLPIPTEFLTEAWFFYWGVLKSHEQTPKGPFSNGIMIIPVIGQIPVGTVQSGHRFWMTQHMLNVAPDAPKVGDIITTAGLAQIKRDKQFRIMHRYQAKFMLDENGFITGRTTVGEHIADKGITKVGVGLEAGELFPGSPKIGPYTLPLFESEDNQYNRNPDNQPISSGKTKMSGYSTARIGEKGRNVNWRLFGKDAPWIYSEMVFEVKPDRSVQTTQRASVDISWRDGSVIQGDKQFNNLNIYKAVLDPQDKIVIYERKDLLEMEGKLAPFINSASGRWPEPNIPPSIQ